MKSKKIAVFLVVVMILATLTSCGGTASPFVGKWEIVKFALAGEEYPIAEIFDASNMVTYDIKADGTITFGAPGDITDGKWSASGNTITITYDEFEDKGELQGDVIYFGNLADEMEITIGKVDPSKATNPADEVAGGKNLGSEGALGDYMVKILDAEISEDDDGTYLFVHFEFTNNSDQDASFLFSTYTVATQDDNELERAFMMESVPDDYNNSSVSIAPGETIQLSDAWALTSESEVTIRVQELMAFTATPDSVTQIFTIS